jgi:hypothetical protein
MKNCNLRFLGEILGVISEAREKGTCSCIAFDFSLSNSSNAAVSEFSVLLLLA